MKSYATLESQLAATHAALSVAEDALATAQAEALRLRRALAKIADNIESQVGQWGAARAARFAREVLNQASSGAALDAAKGDCDGRAERCGD